MSIAITRPKKEKTYENDLQVHSDRWYRVVVGSIVGCSLPKSSNVDFTNRCKSGTHSIWLLGKLVHDRTNSN